MWMWGKWHLFKPASSLHWTVAWLFSLVIKFVTLTCLWSDKAAWHQRPCVCEREAGSKASRHFIRQVWPSVGSLSSICATNRYLSISPPRLIHVRKLRRDDRLREGRWGHQQQGEQDPVGRGAQGGVRPVQAGHRRRRQHRQARNAGLQGEEEGGGGTRLFVIDILIECGLVWWRWRFFLSVSFFLLLQKQEHYSWLGSIFMGIFSLTITFLVPATLQSRFCFFWCSSFKVYYSWWIYVQLGISSRNSRASNSCFHAAWWENLAKEILR